MPLLEIDLGQVYTFSNNNVSGTQVNKFVGLINNNTENPDLPTPLYLINKPRNIISIKKTGNVKEYILVLTFEKI